MTAVRTAWDRLEALCRQHHPPLLDFLNPGATADEIALLERHVGQALPGDLRESLMIHDGQDDAGAGFIFGDRLLSIKTIIERREFWKDFESYNDEFGESMTSFPPDAIQLHYTNAGWVPLTRDAGANHLGVDLAPGPAGSLGQVINFGRDEERKCVLAPNWGAFLNGIAAILESGNFYLDDSSFRIKDPDAHIHDVLNTWRRAGLFPPAAR